MCGMWHGWMKSTKKDKRKAAKAPALAPRLARVFFLQNKMHGTPPPAHNSREASTQCHLLAARTQVAELADCQQCVLARRPCGDGERVQYRATARVAAACVRHRNAAVCIGGGARASWCFHRYHASGQPRKWETRKWATTQPWCGVEGGADEHRRQAWLRCVATTCTHHC